MMNKIKENKKKLLIIGGSVLAVIILVIVLVFALGGNNKKEDTKPTTTTEVPTEEPTTEEPTTEDPFIGKARSYLTGEYIDEKLAKKRPVAVMINNISTAMPQSSISNASVIYEAPVEGGITRMMALFEDYSGLERIGSIRSCRIYYCYLALEWDAIYCHYGQSKYALDFLNSDAIDNVSANNAGSYFYRASDRVSPHNAYINTEGIDKGIESLGYRRKYEDNHQAKIQFADYGTEIDLTNGSVANRVDISYSHNKPYFIYDEASKNYLRYQFGEEHIDDQNNETMAVKNIVVQRIKNSMYPDGKSLDITLNGTGEGYYITNGKAIEITWSKDKQKSGITTYKDKATGEEIKLNTGKTWFCLVQDSTDVTFSK